MRQTPKLYETPFGLWWLYETDLVCSKIRSGEGWDVWLDPVISERVRVGSTCIDVGAHVGWFTRKMLEAGAGAVLAVEPQFPLLAALILNCGATGDQMMPLPICAGETFGFAQMASPERQLTQIVEDYHLMPSAGSIAYEMEGVGPQVLQAPLDAYALSLVSFVKIDAQGMDFKALQGMERLLARDHPAVVFEWEPALWALHGAVLDDATGWLAARGYSSEHLSENNYLALWEGR